MASARRAAPRGGRAHVPAKLLVRRSDRYGDQPQTSGSHDLGRPDRSVSGRRRNSGGLRGPLPPSPSAAVDGQACGRYAAMPLSRIALCARWPLRLHPRAEQIPQGAKVRCYPVVERYHWIWIWMGDPALADPAAITDFHWLDDPNWGPKGDYLYVDANWQLVVDNLLDLTHLAFVHDTTIGNLALAEHARVKVARTPDGVAVTRWIINQEPPPTFKKVGGFRGNVDRWQIIDFTPPAFVRLDVGATQTGTGAPEGVRVGGINMRNLNAITPETQITSHYFWGQAHDFDVKNPQTTNKIFEQIQTAFLQDVAVFSAQQRNLNLIRNPPQIDIAADAGAIQARRILARLYGEEQASARGAAAE